MPVGFGEEVRSQPQIAVKQRRNKAKLEMAAMGRGHARQAKRKAEPEKFDHQLEKGIGHARKRSKNKKKKSEEPTQILQRKLRRPTVERMVKEHNNTFETWSGCWRCVVNRYDENESSMGFCNNCLPTKPTRRPIIRSYHSF
jgi:hypothetical protein